MGPRDFSYFVLSCVKKEKGVLVFGGLGPKDLTVAILHPFSVLDEVGRSTTPTVQARFGNGRLW